MASNKTLYEVVGLAVTASSRDIEAEAARLIWADFDTGREEAMQFQKALRILSDPAARWKYDQSIGYDKSKLARELRYRRWQGQWAGWALLLYLAVFALHDNHARMMISILKLRGQEVVSHEYDCRERFGGRDEVCGDFEASRFEVRGPSWARIITSGWAVFLISAFVPLMGLALSRPVTRACSFLVAARRGDGRDDSSAFRLAGIMRFVYGLVLPGLWAYLISRYTEGSIPFVIA